MAKKYRNKVFWIIRDRLERKYPRWSSRQVFAVTTKICRKNTK